MQKIRREKRTTILEVIVRGKQEILRKINKIGIDFVSIFLLKARVSYLTIFKRKNVSMLRLPLKDETDKFVTCLVLLECLSVKNCMLPSDSEANRDGADAEFPFPLFISFSGSFKSSSP